MPSPSSCTQLTLLNLVFCTQYVDVFITFKHSILFLRFYTSPPGFSFVYHPRGQFRVARAQASGQSQSWGSEGRPLLPCLVLVPVLSALGLGDIRHTLNWWHGSFATICSSVKKPLSRFMSASCLLWIAWEELPLCDVCACMYVHMCMCACMCSSIRATTVLSQTSLLYCYLELLLLSYHRKI